MSFVVVQRNKNGAVQLRAAVDTEVLVIDVDAMEADPTLAIRHVVTLMSYQHADAIPIAQQLLTWFEANATVTPQAGA